jgi:hypothetical protein
MNYPLFAISIIGITAFGIMLLTYLWEKCVIGGEGLQGNYASDDEEEEEEELVAGASESQARPPAPPSPINWAWT